MTHSELVVRAASWLRNELNCGVVLCELVTIGQEIPDVIGWVNQRSIVVECKTSRSDFLSDLKKSHRNPLCSFSLGVWRFYFAPAGIIPADKLPEGWGLYELNGRSVRHAAGVKYRNTWSQQPPFESNWRGEKIMLLSALRRAQKTARSKHD